MQKEIYITQSLHEPNAYFIFRPIGSGAVTEIKFSISPKSKLIKCSEILMLHEINFIRENIIDAFFKVDSSVTNTNWYDSHFIKKTYNKIQ